MSETTVADHVRVWAVNDDILTRQEPDVLSQENLLIEIKHAYEALSAIPCKETFYRSPEGSPECYCPIGALGEFRVMQEATEQTKTMWMSPLYYQKYAYERFGFFWTLGFLGGVDAPKGMLVGHIEAGDPVIGGYELNEERLSYVDFRYQKGFEVGLFVKIDLNL